MLSNHGPSTRRHSNGASGTATVSLRNLGAARTLVLIDGRRMGYGSPNDVAADLNQIPEQLIERVEVRDAAGAVLVDHSS